MPDINVVETAVTTVKPARKRAAIAPAMTAAERKEAIKTAKADAKAASAAAVEAGKTSARAATDAEKAQTNAELYAGLSKQAPKDTYLKEHAKNLKADATEYAKRAKDATKAEALAVKEAVAAGTKLTELEATQTT